ncbi:hypothetical protein HPULCUR_003256 [Helicostylum pulchrum]|uniref:Uncharacterized protein n=1 Tax=Helicostylum pulchrum TaxID=562976 RepID=A0ABP9XU48_9FUNG
MNRGLTFSEDLSDVYKPDNEYFRSRIKCLKSVTKHLLFSPEEPTTVEDVQKEIPDATENEVTTVNLQKVGATAEKEPTSYISRILNNNVVIEENKKDLPDLKQAVDTLQNKNNNLKEELCNLYKSVLVMQLTVDIKTGKAKLKDDNSNNDLITRLKDTKKKRQEAYQAIQLDKKLEEKSAGSAKEEESVCILTGETRGVYKAEECRLSEVDKSFSFSGTNNGIINMSTTTQFTLDRFKFHSELYNRYQVLEELDIDIQDHINYLDLPQQNQVINSADIDVGCSHRKARKKLERAKKHTEEGKEVSKVEDVLSKSPVTVNNTALSQYQNAFNLHASKSDQLQKFYSSKKRASLLRANEIKKSRFLDKLVDSERRKIVSGGGNIIQYNLA